MRQNVWQELRVVGVEDGGFSRKLLDYGAQKALLVYVLLQGIWVKDFQVDMITVDGLDATEKVIAMLHRSSFDAVMLAGVSYAGFNLVDPMVVFEKFDKPIVVVSRTKPNNVAVKNALFEHFEDWRVRWSVFEKLGPIYEVVSASKLIRTASTCCRIPEPIRVARLIARGLTRIS